MIQWIERLPELLKRRLRSCCFDTTKFAPLDTVHNSAYTTEFLDGPEKLVEENRSTTSVKRGHALIGILKNMNKGTDKVKAGMDKKRLEYYKKKLLARREELTKTIARTQEEGRTADEDPTVDLADKAANSYTKEFLFGMTNTDRAILNMIDAALKRIQTGMARASSSSDASAAKQQRVRAWFAQASDALVSVFFPSGCRICDNLLTSASRIPLCEECLSSFGPVAGTLCEICGRPLPGW